MKKLLLLSTLMLSVDMVTLHGSDSQRKKEKKYRQEQRRKEKKRQNHPEHTTHPVRNGSSTCLLDPENPAFSIDTISDTPQQKSAPFKSTTFTTDFIEHCENPINKFTDKEAHLNPIEESTPDSGENLSAKESLDHNDEPFPVFTELPLGEDSTQDSSHSSEEEREEEIVFDPSVVQEPPKTLGKEETSENGNQDDQSAPTESIPTKQATSEIIPSPESDAQPEKESERKSSSLNKTEESSSLFQEMTDKAETQDENKRDKEEKNDNGKEEVEEETPQDKISLVYPTLPKKEPKDDGNVDFERPGTLYSQALEEIKKEPYYESLNPEDQNTLHTMLLNNTLEVGFNKEVDPTAVAYSTLRQFMHQDLQKAMNEGVNNKDEEVTFDDETTEELDEEGIFIGFKPLFLQAWNRVREEPFFESLNQDDKELLHTMLCNNVATVDPEQMPAAETIALNTLREFNNAKEIEILIGEGKGNGDDENSTSKEQDGPKNSITSNDVPEPLWYNAYTRYAPQAGIFAIAATIGGTVYYYREPVKQRLIAFKNTVVNWLGL